MVVKEIRFGGAPHSPLERGATAFARGSEEDLPLPRSLAPSPSPLRPSVYIYIYICALHIHIYIYIYVRLAYVLSSLVVYCFVVLVVFIFGGGNDLTETMTYKMTVGLWPPEFPHTM